MMDITAAVSEPFAKLSAFHIAFNRNVKLSFGALGTLENRIAGADGLIHLPTGGEPWGSATRWRSLTGPVRDAVAFLAELGIARATGAFEDYLVAVKGEFDRAGLVASRPFGDGTGTFDHLDALLGVDPALIADTARMATFFDVARNCVVHRSNRASPQLVALRAHSAFEATLEGWPKRVGNWTISLPPIELDAPIDWRPRHAIMASDAYYRSARLIDRALVDRLGALGLVRTTAYWCFVADPPTPSPAKHDAGRMIRAQLADRHRLRGVTMAEVIQALRDAGIWDDVRRAFDARFPDGPGTAGPRRRRARRTQGRQR